MTVFFSADQHFGHARIIGYCGRPFNDVHHMDEELIARFNATVTPDDTTWHLGDFTMDASRVSRMLGRLNGTHHLVCGNHDKCHPRRKNNHDMWVQRYLQAGFASVQERHIMNIEGMGDVLLIHFPRGRHEGDKFAAFRPNDWEGPILCGHVHEKWLTNGLQLNIGVDQWEFRPVSVEQGVEFHPGTLARLSLSLDDAFSCGREMTANGQPIP